MFEIGRLCVKLAGRDAGLKCVVVDSIDERMVLIDGQTRRRKCNIAHLEPLDKILKIKKNASNDEVVKALKEEGIDITEKKKEGIPTEKTAKPSKSGKSKSLVAPSEEKVKKIVKKTKKE